MFRALHPHAHRIALVLLAILVAPSAVALEVALHSSHAHGSEAHILSPLEAGQLGRHEHALASDEATHAHGELSAEPHHGLSTHGHPPHGSESPNFHSHRESTSEHLQVAWKMAPRTTTDHCHPLPSASPEALRADVDGPTLALTDSRVSETLTSLEPGSWIPTEASLTPSPPDLSQLCVLRL